MSILNAIWQQLKSRTNLAALAIVIVGWLQANILTEAELGVYYPIALSLIGAAMVFLRNITTKPLQEK